MEQTSSRVYVQLVRLFCSLQVYRAKLLGYHWNIKGQYFYELHLLFERLYGEVDGLIDRLAEIVRKFGVAPAAFSVYLKYSVVEEDITLGVASVMINNALSDVPKLYAAVQDVITSAPEEVGVQNLMGDVYETLDKINYLLTHSQMGA